MVKASSTGKTKPSFIATDAVETPYRTVVMLVRLKTTMNILPRKSANGNQALENTAPLSSCDLSGRKIKAQVVADR